MAAAPSYTKVTHSTTYPGINSAQLNLSTTGKVVLITGASGGIGRATAISFAASGPKALVLLGRRAEALDQTASAIKESYPSVIVKTHTAEICDAPAVREVMSHVLTDFGSIDILIHAAGVLAPVEKLVDADPSTFLDGYKTTVLGTLMVAQSVILANKEKPVTFINLTAAGVLFPPFAETGAYVSRKLAVVKLLEVFATGNPQVRLHNVHPGFLETAMSAKLAEKVKLPFAYDEISLPADFLVWIVSWEADFLRNKIVFASWDIDELKERKKEITGGPPGSGQLWLGYTGFPRFVGGQALPGRG